MRVVGMDPGLRNFGVCVGYVDPHTLRLDVEKVATFSTSPCRDMSAAQDLLCRLENLYYDIGYWVRDKRDYEDVYAVCVEAYSRPPSATAAIKLGAAQGVVASLIADWCPEFVYVRSPQHIRKALIQMPKKGDVPPEELVHEALLSSWEELRLWKDSAPKYQHEHALDAWATIAAAQAEGMFLE